MIFRIQSRALVASRVSAGLFLTFGGAWLLPACASESPGGGATTDQTGSDSTGSNGTSGSTSPTSGAASTGGNSTGNVAPSTSPTTLAPTTASDTSSATSGGSGTASDASGTASATDSTSADSSASTDHVSHPVPGHKDHCVDGYDPLPNDQTMTAGPFIFQPEGGGPADTVVQPEVLEWMTENEWQGAHVIWHAFRGCANGSASFLLAPLGLPNLCTDFAELVPSDQNCRDVGDGYQYLLFHRHMLETLKQLWPNHAADFSGFPTFPKTKADLPEVWNANDPTWSATILEAADIADNIQDHLDLFPDEGSFGFWLQCAVGTRAPSFAPNMPYIGLHFNLHDQWSRGANSTHGLNNGQVNITNYMFWKLHGWIDVVWEKYRVAKGITTDAAKMEQYKKDMIAQCREHDAAREILSQAGVGGEPMLDCPPVVDESGVFHDTVRPILENERNHCSACHGPAQTSPYAGLTLGGQISSKCMIERLKRDSISGGQFKLVEPGEPEQSWLYLKAAGLAESAGCVSDDNACNTAAMPPSGKTMTDAELTILYDWIASGAN